MQYDYAVQTKKLYKAFDGKEVIHECSMNVKRGSIYGFWGKNEAGKRLFSAENDIVVIVILLVILSVLGAFESPAIQAFVPQRQTSGKPVNTGYTGI